MKLAIQSGPILDLIFILLVEIGKVDDRVQEIWRQDEVGKFYLSISVCHCAQHVEDNLPKIHWH